MHTQTAPVSKPRLWAGRAITALVVLFMLFDAIIKIIKHPAAMEGTAQLGYPVSVVFPLGIVVLVCTAAYAIPRTSVLGAILLTAFLGGATATQVRVGSLSYLFPIGLGVLVWAGLFLRDDNLRALIPVRK